MERPLRGDESLHQPFEGHVAWHLTGLDLKMLLKVPSQHSDVFHGPKLQDKPGFLFLSERGIRVLPPIRQCHPVTLKPSTCPKCKEGKFVENLEPKTPQKVPLKILCRSDLIWLRYLGSKMFFCLLVC